LAIAVILQHKKKNAKHKMRTNDIVGKNRVLVTHMLD
jgi:hypothetical protein